MLEKPTLSDPHVVLRPLGVQDVAPMLAALAEAETMRLTGTQATFTRAEVQRHCERVAVADDRMDFAITRPGDPTYIGEAVLNNIDWHNRSANYRIALAAPQYFGQGYGTAATRLVVAYGWHTLKLHRIELEVYDFNPRAQHVYEKIGFTVEGVRRDVLLWQGQYHSAIMMSLLAPEN